jgi:hypothetical protein
MKLFIMQSGRSGSLYFSQLLKKNNFQNVNHEFNLMKYKPELVKYLIKKNDYTKKKFIKKFEKDYLEKITNQFVDVSYGISNKICAELIKKKFPDAKIVVVFRDGFKVVNSWINKLGQEIYDPKSMDALRLFILNKKKTLPRAKKFWWPINLKKKKFTKNDQLKYICDHWVNIFYLSNFLRKKYKENLIVLKFEDFLKKKEIRKKFFNFINLNKFFFFRRRVNIVNKMHNTLNKNQIKIFNKKTFLIMKKLGYKIPRHEL